MRASILAPALAALLSSSDVVESRLPHGLYRRTSRRAPLPRRRSKDQMHAAAALGRLAPVPRGGGCDCGDAACAAVCASLGEVLVEKGGGLQKVSSVTDHPRGGGKSNDVDGAVNVLGLVSLPPRALATLSMAACMSLHYLAYSLARPATMTLFTSSRLGYGGSKSAYPFAMTFISPVSFLLLLFYGGVLEGGGPLFALKSTTLGCAAVLGLCALALARLDPFVDSNPPLAKLARYVVGALFVFRESYVQLITSQHWSFISSVLTPNQSSTWFAPISGLTSVTSAGAAVAVGKLSELWGLQGVLGVAASVLGVSVLFGGAAYSIAEKVSCV